MGPGAGEVRCRERFDGEGVIGEHLAVESDQCHRHLAARLQQRIDGNRVVDRSGGEEVGCPAALVHDSQSALTRPPELIGVLGSFQW